MRFDSVEADLLPDIEWVVKVEKYDQLIKDKDHKYTTDELDEITEYRLDQDSGFWEVQDESFSFIGLILTLFTGATGLFVFPIVWLILCGIVVSSIEYDPNGSIFNIFSNQGGIMGFFILFCMGGLAAFGAYGIFCMLTGNELQKYKDRFEREVNFNVQVQADYEQQLEDERTNCEELIKKAEEKCNKEMQRFAKETETKAKEASKEAMSQVQKFGKDTKIALLKADEIVKEKEKELSSYKKEAADKEKELANKDRELRRQEITLAKQEATIAKLSIKLSKLETKLLKQGHEDWVLAEEDTNPSDL